MDCDFEPNKEKKDLFLEEYLSKRFQPGAIIATCRCFPHTDPGTPRRRKSAPNSVESIPGLQAEGAQCLAQLQGWLWGREGTWPRTAPSPKVSPCGSHHGAFGSALTPTATPELLSPP